MLYSKVKKHWKYTVERDEVYRTGITPPAPIKHEYFELESDGTMTVKKGYKWDGPSWPAFHTENFMTPSAFHDAGYQAQRLKLLPRSYQGKFDDLLQQMQDERGMSKVRQPCR